MLGIGLSVTNYGQVLRICREWIAQRRAWNELGSPADSRPPGRYATFLSVHPVMTAVFDRGVSALLNSADIAATDGMPLVWALRSFGAKDQRRVYGPDTMLALCGQAARLGHRVFLYGGRDATLQTLCSRLQTKFPALEIAGAYAPPFRPLTPEEDRAAVEQILVSRADIVFVGIGAPKQDRWILEHRAQLPGVVMLAVGAAFDFHAGSVRQAPHWMQRRGLEWLFRLAAEPQRLWRRYLVVNPLFLVLWALQSVFRRSGAAPSAAAAPGSPSSPAAPVSPSSPAAPEWTLQHKRLKFSVGGFLLYAVRLKALVLNGVFAELPDDPAHTPLPLDTSPQDVRAALVLAHPVRSPLPRIAFTRGLIRYAPHQYRRSYLEVEGSFDQYLSRWSHRRRSHVRREVHRFLCSGSNQGFREYSRPEEMAEYYRLARDVSAKTYQEHLVDAGLPETAEFLDQLIERAQRHAVQGYILFHNGAPAAYAYCPSEGPVLLYERIGYDPAARRWGPGKVLLFLIVERLFITRRFRRLDFGAGESEYKQVFGTGYRQCADIYFFRRTPGHIALVAAHSILNAAWGALAVLLDRLGIRGKLKNLMRSQYGRH